MKFQTITADGVTETVIDDSSIVVVHDVKVMPSSNPETGATLGVVMRLGGHPPHSTDPTEAVLILDGETLGRLVLASATAAAACDQVVINAYMTGITGGR